MHAHLPSARLWRSFRADWWGLLKRTYSSTDANNTSLLAAGTAFYGFSSIAPVLAATVLVYGLIATPETVTHNIRALFGALPRDAASLIGAQLDNVAAGSGSKKGLGLVIALVLAIYGGSKAAGSMMAALNVSYGVHERRSFIVSNLVAAGIVAGSVLLMLAGVLSTTAVAFLSALIPGAPGIVLTVIGLLSYVVLALLAVTGVALLYRFGPDVPGARFRWGTPGAVIATIVWLAASAGFGVYAANFGNYGATYGSLSAIVVLLTWLWLSAYAFLLGAELDAQVGKRVAPAAAPVAPPAPEKAPTRAKKTGPVGRAGLSVLGLLLLLRRGRTPRVTKTRHPLSSHP